MEYTKNYHLPQWAEEDRVMRTDFNTMCADIESGLTKTAADGETAKGLTWDALLRAGRRVMEEKMPLFERDRLYCVNGLLFNPMTSAGLADTLNGTAWHERLGVYAGRGEEIPEDVLLAKCSKCKGSTYGASNPVSVYHFTAPFDGVIKGFTLFLRSHLRETASRAELNMEFIAERMSGSTGSEIFRKSIQVVREGTATLEEELPVTVRVPIKKGAKYQLSLKLTRDPGISGGFGFVNQLVEGALYGDYVDHSKFHVVYPPITAASHTRSFPTEGRASRALAVVRYRKEEEASTIMPSIGGKAMTRTNEQTLQDTEGLEYREAWFTGEKQVNGTAQFKIAVACSETDDVRLLEYGVMLL